MKVLILCQETVLSEGLECLLEEMPTQAEVVGSTDNGREGVALAKNTKPEVALVGIQLKELNGIDAVRQMLADAPDLRVLMLATDVAPGPLSEALDAGAMGFITIESDAKELERALRSILDGKPYLCAETTSVLIRQSKHGVEDPVFSLLTPREREVLQLLAEGYGAKDIGARLHISSKTVDTHRQNIMNKLETDNLPDLVKHAIRAGLTTLKVDG